MSYGKWRIFALLLPLMLASCVGKNHTGEEASVAPSATVAVSPSAAAPTPTPEPTPVDPVAEAIRGMSLKQKLGQMLIAGVSGTAMDESARKLIADRHIGGFILYKANMASVGQTVELLNDLKEANRNAAGIPLFLSVDQEGGKVSRLPAEITALPASRTIAQTGKKAKARAAGSAMGEQLRAFGFNVNYAPVLDIDSNPNNPVIGSRSFGAKADIVTEYGLEQLEGLQNSGTIGVVKHFPGHGDTSVDSHLELPVVNKTLDQLQKLELLPFSAAVAGNTDAVMVAHILLPRLDPDSPATMSREIIQGLLREDMGFEGVVITDDMTMGAIVEHYALGDAVVRAVQAGSDLILVAHGYDNANAALDALEQAVESGKLNLEQIDESVYRILSLKQRYQLEDQPAGPVDVQALNAQVKAILDSAD